MYLTTLDDSTLHAYGETTGGIPVTPSTNYSLAAGPFPLFPGGVAVDPSGNIYVSDITAAFPPTFTADPNIYKFSSTGQFQGVFATMPSSTANPGSLHWNSAPGAANGLYAGNFTGNNVEHFSATGTDLGAAATINPADQVAAFTFSPSGTMYVAGYSSGSVYSIGAGGVGTVFVDNTTLPANEQLQAPGGLVFDPSGHIVVSNTYGDKIEQFDGTNGSFIKDIAGPAQLGGSPGLGTSVNPEDLIVSRDGHSLLVALSGVDQTTPTGSLAQVNLSTGATTFVESNLFVPTGIAYGPVGVPEPGTATLAVLAGAGLLLAARRSGYGRRSV